MKKLDLLENEVNHIKNSLKYKIVKNTKPDREIIELLEKLFDKSDNDSRKDINKIKSLLSNMDKRNIDWHGIQTILLVFIAAILLIIFFQNISIIYK